MYIDAHNMNTVYRPYLYFPYIIREIGLFGVVIIVNPIIIIRDIRELLSFYLLN